MLDNNMPMKIISSDSSKKERKDKQLYYIIFIKGKIYLKVN
jgi:hypothetical protein